MVKQELSEYEKQRQANIAERDVLLKKLALEAAGSGLVTKKSASKPSSGKASKPRRSNGAAPVKREPAIATRKSSRIAGIEADSEVAKRKHEEQMETQREQERIKRQRVTEDVSLADVAVAGRGALANGTAHAFTWDLSGRGAKPYVRTFDPAEPDVKTAGSKELQALRERMGGLELYDGFDPSRIKITPERIYAMAFHPTPEKALVFAGDKLGNLGIFDASQTVPEYDAEDEDADVPDPIVNAFHVHSRTITSIHFSPLNASHCVTSSYDSSIRLLDLASSKSTELYGPDDREADEPLSGLEIVPENPHVMYFSRLDGHLGRIDTRDKSQPTIWQLSEKKIGGFSLNPRYPYFLATASLDRTMALWDVRKMVKWEGSGKRPSCIGVHSSRLSVSHASFNSVGQVSTTSYDDTIKIYGFEGMKDWSPGQEISEQEMEPAHIVKHNNQTGRWVTILRAQWQQDPQDKVQRFVIGNMNRFVDIYTGKGEQLAQLGADNITAVPAVAQFHPTKDWICGGTASGKLCLWT